MPEPHGIRAYEYVIRPYARVRETLCADPLALFQRATTTATQRATALASLHATIAGVDIAADAIIDIPEIASTEADPLTKWPRTRIALEWRAARGTAWFPVMMADLCAYPLTKGETQLDFDGQYRPPLGFLGEVIDAIVGRQIAEATVHSFVAAIAARLAQEIPAAS